MYPLPNLPPKGKASLRIISPIGGNKKGGKLIYLQTIIIAENGSFYPHN
jgi:hypothetical protein